MANGLKSARSSVRLEDVARAAGVSPITVSRAINTPNKVRPQTRKRVADAIAVTGYVINSFASILASGKSSIVTVLVANYQNPYLGETVQGLLDVLRGHDLRPMFIETGWDKDVTPDIINTILPFRPAGVVLTSVGADRESRRLLLSLDVPIVEIGSRPNPVDMNVQTSAYEAGFLMGRHFGEQQFKNVAYCGYSLHSATERLLGFEAGLEAFGVSLGLRMPLGKLPHSFEMGIKAFRAILEQFPVCDAIYFGNDHLAFGALTEAQRLGIAVPGQVAVAGYGGLEFVDHLNPALTTIDFKSYQSGQLAGQMLLTRLKGQTVERSSVILPITLKQRASTLRPQN